mgnify:CR=1 FL=1
MLDTLELLDSLGPVIRVTLSWALAMALSLGAMWASEYLSARPADIDPFRRRPPPPEPVRADFRHAPLAKAFARPVVSGTKADPEGEGA